MKYIGEPNCTVIDYERLKPVFVFNENGEYETNDPKIIDFMKKKKPHIKAVESDLIKCKKCEFACSNKGELMAHYRKEHPKEGD